MARPTPADPLADLRQETPAGPPETPAQPQEPEAATLGAVEGVLDESWHADAASMIVARWHADATAAALAHKGGGCGCRYLASTALLEVLGAPVTRFLPDPEEQPE